MTAAATGTPSRSLADARRWTERGTALVRDALAGLDETGLDETTTLPGWTRRHVVAHLAANADAISNLVRWAATGERTPMYSSPEQRAADIERGSALTGDELRAWFDVSAVRLDSGMAALGREQWAADVVTAQGRTVPAAETAWMRAREVMVHAVDLRVGVTFADLPEDFLEALRHDVLAKRADLAPVDAPLPQQVAWLTGRPHDLTDAPALPPWL